MEAKFWNISDWTVGHARRVSDDTDGVAFRIDRSIGTC